MTLSYAFLQRKLFTTWKTPGAGSQWCNGLSALTEFAEELFIS